MSNKSKDISTFKLIAIFSSIFLIWLIYWLIISHIVPEATDRGTFGDMFGAIGALFAGLAFAGLIVTIFIQQKQIRLIQAESDRQNIENRFLNLIGLQNKILEQIVVTDDKGNIRKGKDAFKVIFEDIDYLYNIFSKKSEEYWEDERLANLLTAKYVGRYWPDYFPEHEQEFKASFAIDYISQQKIINNEIEKLKHVYFAIFHKYHTEVGHYFRHLYHILKFLSTKELEEKSKEIGGTSYSKFKSYADILQAQMSSSEMLVLFFNGLCFKNMRKLVYHYKFLENLAKDFLIKEEHVEHYSGEEIDEIKYDKIEFKSLDALIK